MRSADNQQNKSAVSEDAKTLKDAIRFKAAEKRYRDTTALQPLTTCIKTGELTALLGPNGAGKTSLISLALGLTRPTTGRVEVMTELSEGMGDAYGLAGSLSARTSLGAMLQAAALPDQLTPREHLCLFAGYHRSPMPFDQVVAQLDLSGFLDKRYGTLSGGQARRVQLAVALIGNPALLILDEPTVGLDIEARTALWAIIRDLVASGRGVLLTTHYLEEADALADRIMMLRQGHVVADGPSDHVRARVGGKVISFRAPSLEPAPGGAARWPLPSVLPAAGAIKSVGNRWQINSSDPQVTLAALMAQDLPLADLSVQDAGLEEAFAAIMADDQRPEKQEPRLASDISQTSQSYQNEGEAA